MVNIRENPNKMDDLGVPLFLETPICPYVFIICFLCVLYKTGQYQPFFLKEGMWKGRVVCLTTCILFIDVFEYSGWKLVASDN